MSETEQEQPSAALLAEVVELRKRRAIPHPDWSAGPRDDRAVAVDETAPAPPRPRPPTDGSPA
ncbi:hypothetical protein ACGFYU_11620 [Streptomyces sp. NPDC048337]|uniref:hypothetical protein n=1 Tax=Streptomyces sp. NPDC048337 TaxID=3365535 RepID=UPI003713F110